MSRARRRTARDTRLAATATTIAQYLSNVDAGSVPGGDRSSLPPYTETTTIERTAVRYLGIAHLGRWVSLPGRPPRTAATEPSLAVTAGRLVGFRGGRAGELGHGPWRILVLQQGGLTAPVEAEVGAPVEVL